MHLFSTTCEVKQEMPKYNRLAVNLAKTYAVLGDCLSIGNTTVCQEKDLLRLKENDCIPRLLKGGHAAFTYLRNDQEVVYLIDVGTLLLSNFNGSVTFDIKKHYLVGSFVVQFSNKTITVGNQNCTTYCTTYLMAMPAVLTRVTSTDYQLSLKYVHEVSNQNL